MSKETQKATFLREHLPYELLMLRYTLKKLAMPQNILDWNAYFESFATHGRNLYCFLTNDKDSKNFKARDFINQFDAGKTNDTIGAFSKLNPQIFHLGKQRKNNKIGKANTEEANQIGCWIEANFSMFIDGLGHEYGSNWNWNDADPSEYLTNSPSISMSDGHTASITINKWP